MIKPLLYDKKYWADLKDIETPEECIPCKLCKTRCMETEAVEDRDGKGQVIRINSMCDQSLEYEKDDIRTEFDIPRKAIKEWNERNKEIK